MTRSLTLSLLIIVLALLAACEPPAANENQIKLISIGSHATLKGGPEATALGVNSEDAADWLKSSGVGDKHGVYELIESGRVFTVDNGTKVLVIDSSGSLFYKVRILEGEHAGRAGWTVGSTLKQDKN